MKWQDAMELSNVIYQVSKRHKIPSKIYTAILMQESRYKLNALAKSCGFRELASVNKVKYNFAVSKKNVGCVYTDFGIAQVHYKSILRQNLDHKRLLTDLNYSVNAGAEILSYFARKFAKKEPHRWFCRYNVGTQSANKVKIACSGYIKLVKRWM